MDKIIVDGIEFVERSQYGQNFWEAELSLSLRLNGRELRKEKFSLHLVHLEWGEQNWRVWEVTSNFSADASTPEAAVQAWSELVFIAFQHPRVANIPG